MTTRNVPKRRTDPRMATAGATTPPYSQRKMKGRIVAVDPDSEPGDPRYYCESAEQPFGVVITTGPGYVRPEDRLLTGAEDPPILFWFPRGIGDTVDLALPDSISNPDNVVATLVAAREKCDYTDCSTLAATGPWEEGRAYRANEQAELEGSSYLARIDHTATNANRPKTGGDWEEAWALLARGTANPIQGPSISTKRSVPTWVNEDGAELRDNPDVTIDASGNLVVPTLKGRDPARFDRSLLLSNAQVTSASNVWVPIPFNITQRDSGAGLGLWTPDGVDAVTIDHDGGVDVSMEGTLTLLGGASGDGAEVRLEIDRGSGYQFEVGTLRGLTYSLATISLGVTADWSFEAKQGDKVRFMLRRNTGVGTVYALTQRLTMRVRKDGA